jgi:hypothetical protein
MKNRVRAHCRSGLAWGALLLQLTILAEPGRGEDLDSNQSQTPSQKESQGETQVAVPLPTTTPDKPAAVQPTPLPPYKPPNLNPTQVPSAYVAEWGNYFVAASVYGYENGNGSSGLTTDGAVSVGVGAGNARKFVAVEVDFNLESFADTNNGGTLDVRLGRQLIGTHNFVLQLGAGWLGVASYGTWPDEDGSPYGVITAAWALRPDDPVFRQTLQINLGGGDGRFQRLDAVDLPSSGVIASLGVELAPNLGISAGWAGRGLNASLSYVPLRGVPLYLSFSGANITNVDSTGRAVAFSVSWGGSFRTATFP